MESLKELLRQCSKESLEEAMENVCELLQVVEQGKTEQVKCVICESLTKQKWKEQRQQENDQNALAVVLGARDISDVAGAGGRGRACTGLMVVGSDALTIVSTFLAWDKVELQRELEFGNPFLMGNLRFSPCGNFILTCSAPFSDDVSEVCKLVETVGCPQRGARARFRGLHRRIRV